MTADSIQGPRRRRPADRPTGCGTQKVPPPAQGKEFVTCGTWDLMARGGILWVAASVFPKEPLANWMGEKNGFWLIGSEINGD